MGKVWFLSWFGFVRSRLGGVCGWNILASAVKLLLRFLCGIGRVSWFGFSGVGRFGLQSLFGFGFLGLVLVVFARPLCINSSNVVPILVNCFWLWWGCGFGFFLRFGFGIGF